MNGCQLGLAAYIWGAKDGYWNVSSGGVRAVCTGMLWVCAVGCR